MTQFIGVIVALVMPRSGRPRHGKLVRQVFFIEGGQDVRDECETINEDLWG